MSGSHQDVPPELRRLAQTLLDTVDPAIRIAAARATGGSAGKCEQVWCPVCAIAALVTGEQHPLLAVVAEHSVALLAVVRAVLDGTDQTAHPPSVPPVDEPPPSRPGRYQHIPVTIDD